MQNNLIQDPNITKHMPHKYLTILGMIWICVLITTLFTSIKTFTVFNISFPVTVLIYPFVYIFNDIFTEVYGYKVSRKIIWAGLFAMVFSTSIASVFSYIPSSEFFTDNNAFNTIFRSTPIVAAISVASFFMGEFTNSFIISKLKIIKSNLLHVRLILSTLFGQTVDNSTFFYLSYLLAGWYNSSELLHLTVTTVVFCTLWEILMLPITHRLIKFLKQSEGIDTYDRGVEYNPFRIK